MANPVFKLGMLFSNNKVFKEAVLTHVVLTGRGFIWLKKNESFRMRFKCAEGCPRKISAHKMQHEDTLQVKKYTKIHTCSRVLENKQIKSTWLANKFLQEFKKQPEMLVKDVVELVWKVSVLSISDSQALRTRQRALKLIQGSVAEQYPKLWNYVEELKLKMPGITAEIVTENEKLATGKLVFKRIYICLSPLKEGFKRCRAVIGVDGTHSKSINGSVLLAAVGIDSNNNVFPLAYAVVETESRETWTSFFEHLKDDMMIVNESGWTFISDKQKGLIAAFKDVIPNCEKGFCFQHMHLNFSIAGHGGLN